MSTNAEEVYNVQAEIYTTFSEDSFSWHYIEKPGLDHYIADFYRPDAKVMDIGCGAGRVSEHLVSRGVNPHNIVGVDVSGEMLKIARTKVPFVNFVRASIADMELGSTDFDLAVSNMTFHHLDNEQLAAALDRIYDHLKPEGMFFFIDTDPDRIEGSLDPANRDQWLYPPTPWGTTIPFFNRDPHALLLDYPYFAGFEFVTGKPLRAAEEGRIDMKKFVDYTERPARIAAKFKKVSQTEKARRLASHDQQVPSLIEIDWNQA